jgi:transposase
MGKAFSQDLRQRVVAHVTGGGTRRGAGRHFGVSASTAVRLVALQRKQGTLEPRRQGRPPGKGKLAPYVEFLLGKVAAQPDITLAELAEALAAEHKVTVHLSSICRILQAAGLTYKKSRSPHRSATATTSTRREPNGSRSSSRACARSPTG